jgi:putative ABC transport system substrate-binding protein
MRRREFITVLGGIAATWPLAARAREPGMPVIGFLRSFPPDESVTRAVRRGLNQVGYVEGKNIEIEIRTAEGRYDRLPNLVADLIERQVAVILALDGPAARAAKSATSTIPIVFLTGVDPVVSGLVASLGRPGGNATGVALVGSEISTKNLDLLCELVPSATTIGVLLNPRNSYHEQYLRAITAAASGRLKQILSLHVATERDFDNAFANLRQQHAEGVVVTDEPFFTSRRAQLVAAAATKSFLLFTLIANLPKLVA